MNMSKSTALNSSRMLPPIHNIQNAKKSFLFDLICPYSLEFTPDIQSIIEPKIMLGQNNNNKHVLQQSWPSFLDKIGNSSSAAMNEFYIFLKKLLTIRPPQCFSSLSEQDREDFIHDFLLECCNDNFKILKKYDNKGKAFSRWVFVVVNNRAIDWIRAKNRHPHISIDNPGKARGDNNDNIASLLEYLATDEPNPEKLLVLKELTDDREKGLKELITLVNDYKDKLPTNKQILLNAAAEGKSPKEISILLGNPDISNKKISDDLRYLKQKLIDHLLINASENAKRILRDSIKKVKKGNDNE